MAPLRLSQTRNTSELSDETAHRDYSPDAQFRFVVLPQFSAEGNRAAGGWIAGIATAELPFLTPFAVWLGRRFGFSGIVIATFLSLLLSALALLIIALIFIAALKYSCETWVGWATDKLTVGVCQNLNSLPSIK